MIRALFFALLLTLSLGGAGGAQAQEPPRHKAEFQLALQAYDGGERPKYRVHLEAMYATLPPKGATATDDYNRPFFLYHLARARALAGDAPGSLAILEEILRDDIEALIVSQASFDTAFDGIRGERAFKKMMRRLPKHPIQVRALSKDLFLLTGAGADILALKSPTGTLLVDTGYAPAASSIQKIVSRLGGGDVTAIINTHLHEDHIGGNAAFGEGIPIYAHPLTRKGMLEPEPFIDEPAPRKPAYALPNVVTPYPLTIHFGEEEIRIYPLPGHTEGDVIVYFVHAGVLHVGDRYFPLPGEVTWMYPGPNLWAHLRTLDALFDGFVEDGTLISGHGEPVALNQLRKSHEAMKEAIEYVELAIDDGMSLEALGEAGIPTEWHEWTQGREAQWLAFFYEEIQADRARFPE